MRLQIGSFLTDANSVVVDCQGTPISDPAGTPPRARTDRISVFGWLTAASQAGIISASLALNAALGSDFVDITFLDDSNNPTDTKLWNAGSTSGVKVISGPTYNVVTPVSLAATRATMSNYTTCRSFAFVAEATYPLQAAGTILAGGVPFGGPGPLGAVPSLQGQGRLDPGTGRTVSLRRRWGGGSSNLPPALGGTGGGAGGLLGQSGSGTTGGLFPGIAPVTAGALGTGIPGSAASVVISYQETVSLSGGGPRIVYLPSINGPGQYQTTYPSTPYLATQSGVAKGWLTYPNPPAPLWPNCLLEAPRVQRISPKRDGLVYAEWEIHWTYSYSSLSPLGPAIPNVYRV